MLCAAWLAQRQKLSSSTVTSYLAAVRSLHVALGLPDPTLGSHRLHRLLRGIRRQGPLSSHSSRLPVTNRIMVILAQSLRDSSFNRVMFWAACCTAFFGFLRVSEFTCPGAFDPSRHLSRDYISLEPAGFFRVHLKVSKTDPFARGCTVFLAPSGPGSVLSGLCLITWLSVVRLLAPYLFARMVAP